jgi:hypothetical protein
MDTRVTRIQELLAKKAEIDGELKTLKDAVKAEAASLRAPRKPRDKKLDGQRPQPAPQPAPPQPQVKK